MVCDKLCSISVETYMMGFKYVILDVYVEGYVTEVIALICSINGSGLITITSVHVNSEKELR